MIQVCRSATGSNLHKSPTKWVTTAPNQSDLIKDVSQLRLYHDLGSFYHGLGFIMIFHGVLVFIMVHWLVIFDQAAVSEVGDGVVRAQDCTQNVGMDQDQEAAPRGDL